MSLCLSLFLALSACGRDSESLAGRYSAQGVGSVPSPVILVLAAEGKATLSMGGEEASLRWNRDTAGELLLHTKDGGVLAARVVDNGLDLALPGDLRVRLRKAAE